MPTPKEVTSLKQRLIDLEIGDLAGALGLYGDLLDAYGLTPSGEPRFPPEIGSILVQKFEDPDKFIDAAAKLAAERRKKPTRSA